jgi:hypothetical protein
MERPCLLHTFFWCASNAAAGLALRVGLAPAFPVPNQALLAAVINEASATMDRFQTDTLCGLAAALGGCGSTQASQVAAILPRGWLDRYCLEVYLRCV